MTVGDRLAHGDNIGRDAAALEGPEVAADASEAGLDFIGHAEAAGFPRQAVGAFEIVSGQRHLTAAAQHPLGDEGANLTASRLNRVYILRYRARVEFTGARTKAAARTRKPSGIWAISTWAGLPLPPGPLNL